MLEGAFEGRLVQPPRSEPLRRLLRAQANLPEHVCVPAAAFFLGVCSVEVACPGFQSSDGVP